MNLISVIIPVYNGEKYIKRCINSLINQTYKNIEIIIINDGSKDNSINIIKEISEKDKRIIIIDKENQGVSIARNAGIEKASGDYIMFVDVDDWVKTNMIEQMYKVIKKENVDIVKCNSINEFNNKATENKISNSLVNKVLKKEEYKN